MSRPLSATITSPNGTPREGLRVDFHGLGDAPNVHAVTDAGGVFVVDLEVGMTYRVPVGNAATVNGVAYPAGTVFIATVPEGEGPIDLASVAVGIEDWSCPAIAARIDGLQAVVVALETRLAALEGVA